MINKDKMTLFVTGMFLLLIMTTGLSYAYFSASISGNENAKDMVVEAGTLRLTYTDSPQIIMQNIKPGQTITKKVTVKNTGTIPAEIINLIESPDYLNNTTLAKTIFPVRLTHNDIVGKVLEPGEELTLSVSAIFDYKAESETKKISYQITLITASVQTK